MKSLPDYLRFVRKQPCLLCGRKGGEAHHEPLGLNAVGSKPPDTHALPLCHECHIKRHQVGAATFWPLPVYLPRECLRLLTRYFCGVRR